MDGLRDLSCEYIENNQDLQALERPIPLMEFLYHSKARDKCIEYMLIKKITETKTHAEYLLNNPVNHLLNRYEDVLPYRDTIVNLSTCQYINANYIIVAPTNSKNVIATQGPLQNTVSTFWKMVWEENVCLIIMCCDFYENGFPKCFEYIPTENSFFFLSLLKSN